MKKITILLTLIILLSGCQSISFSKKNITSEYVKLSCDNFVDYGLKIGDYYCDDGDVYFNYKEKKVYTEFDERHYESDEKYEIRYEDKQYIVYTMENGSIEANEIALDFDDDTFEDIMLISEFLDIIGAYSQKDGTRIIDEDSEDYKKIRAFYYFELNNYNKNDDWVPVLEKIIIKKTSKTSVEITIEQDVYYTDMPHERYTSVTVSFDWGYLKEDFENDYDEIMDLVNLSEKTNAFIFTVKLNML